ncbi:MAG: pentapeptide repeat-containing protein [Peptostreptococcus sp.]|uniref:pentapeptide repeat-containing protein n=1 Tax=Peptostreptococcus sp. TaxID=1262 RepID=UPI002FC6E2F5
MYYENEVFENLNFDKELFKDLQFFECDFINCTFEDCKLKDCSFRDCKFEICKITNLDSKDSNARELEFQRCTLIGINWSKLIYHGALDQVITKLEKNVLKYNVFMDMKFIKFSFSDNIILDSTFENCDLHGSSFLGDELTGTQFSNCDLRRTNFKETFGYRIDIESNKLKGADFSFPEVLSLLDSLEIKIN